MKEKIFKKALPRRILSFILMLAMIITSLMGAKIPVSAATVCSDIGSSNGTDKKYGHTTYGHIYVQRSTRDTCDYIGYSPSGDSRLKYEGTNMGWIESGTSYENVDTYDYGTWYHFDGSMFVKCSDQSSDAHPVIVNSVTLNKSEVTLIEGETVTLSATVAPSQATIKTVSWNSDDTSVATVDSSGKVTAKVPGSATITVETTDGKKTASCNVTVKSAHTHAWDYKVYGASLKAYCTQEEGAEDCTYQGSESDLSNAVSLTLSASDVDYSGSETYDGVSFDNLTDFKTATGLSSDPTITYYKVDTEDATTGGTEKTAADVRKAAGFYYAKATIEGSENGLPVSAVKAFKVNKIDPVVGDFTYTGPASSDYDGNAKSVTVNAKSEVTGLGDITVKYYNSSDVEVTSPTDAGTYKVKITVTAGDNYNAVTSPLVLGTFTIGKGDYTGTNTASANLPAKDGRTVTVTLPALPAGASYGTVTNSNTSFFEVGTVADGKVTVTSKKDWDAETETGSKEFTVAVTESPNYNGYTVTVTITPTFHNHDWKYEKIGEDKIKAHCEAGGHEGDDVTLTITADNPVYDGSTYGGLSLGDGDGEDVGTIVIKYVGRGNTIYSENEIAPTKPGTYTVKVYPASNPEIVVTKDFEIKRKAPETDVDKIIDMDNVNWTYKLFKNGRYLCLVEGEIMEKGGFENILFYNISGTTVTINLGGGTSGSFDDISNAGFSESLSPDKVKELIGAAPGNVGVQVNYLRDSHILQFLIMSHDHDWKYSADGNKIEVYCGRDDGACYFKTYETDKIALTLNAESQTVSQKEAYTGASLENLEAFMEAAELDEEPTIKYFKVDAKGATIGGSEVEAAKVRATAGNYYAAVMVGDATAVKAFEIKDDTATSYDTIVTKEFDTGKSKKGITIGRAGDESGADLNGIITINAKIKVTMLDKEWTPTGYVLSRVTPENLSATKWVSVSGNKVEQKNLKKLAVVKYNAKKKQTLINLKQNKKVEGAVYAIRLEDGKGNTIYMNIECIELAKDIKKSALSVSVNETAPTAEAMLAMADGDTAKTIALTMLGSKTQSEFNSNAVTWVIGSGKNASTLKKGEVKAVADKSGKAIAYLTVADNGTVKVVSGTVKGKVKLTGVVNRKAYKTTVTVK